MSSSAAIVPPADTEPDPVWASCRFLTCSVLPVRRACNLNCPFCFSKSSVSAAGPETALWSSIDLDRYFAYARERGAIRLVVTGGGEPLLLPEVTLRLIAEGRRWFSEIACFTNGTYLTANSLWRCRTRACRICAIPAITIATRSAAR